ncbi:MAG: restriction endonuclease subunit S, partial [Lachnospiraceae bacterium]|nr:restriction endonuclease subunit S [Lachnospiraceae bacterium]
MKSNYKKLGRYIHQIDIRNTENRTDNLLGVSVQKCFIPSIANTVGTDFSKYKIVRKGQFTYIPDTSRRGDKIGIALLTDYDEGLVSNVYTVFEIVDENELDPTYLMLWFSRPEFDRFARFKSHGSVREVFDWDEMCNVELPIPSHDEQLQIVNAYRTVERRIELKRKINDNLLYTAMALYKSWFIDLAPFGGTAPVTWSTGTIDDIAEIYDSQR